MILKEIDLDLPNSDKHSRFSFRNEVRCIAAQYYGFIKKKISTDGFWKILVECIDNDNVDDVPVTYLKVNTVKVSFNYKKYHIKKQDRRFTHVPVLKHGWICQ